mmetsp:Transcript_12163/g.28145  ORF Transcript_12163/g.28145 Transcript_12163/m.28145 type:complete len:231 (+) Transcript_12163:453-1145(+)
MVVGSSERKSCAKPAQAKHNCDNDNNSDNDNDRWDSEPGPGLGRFLSRGRNDAGLAGCPAGTPGLVPRESFAPDGITQVVAVVTERTNGLTRFGSAWFSRVASRGLGGKTHVIPRAETVCVGGRGTRGDKDFRCTASTISTTAAAAMSRGSIGTTSKQHGSIPYDSTQQYKTQHNTAQQPDRSFGRARATIRRFVFVMFFGLPETKIYSLSARNTGRGCSLIHGIVHTAV